MAGSVRRKDRIIYLLDKRVVNPIVLLRGTWTRRPATPCWRRPGGVPGSPRCTPVCDMGLGNWQILFLGEAERGHRRLGLEHRSEPVRPGSIPLAAPVVRLVKLVRCTSATTTPRGEPGQRLLAEANLARRSCATRGQPAMDTEPADGTHRPGCPVRSPSPGPQSPPGRPDPQQRLGRRGQRRPVIGSAVPRR